MWRLNSLFMFFSGLELIAEIFADEISVALFSIFIRSEPRSCWVVGVEMKKKPTTTKQQKAKINNDVEAQNKRF
jgi:hypothetical protein